MKLYYHDDGCIIFHGDCKDVLYSMDMQDLIITDPPYGMSYRSNFRKERFDPIEGDTTFPSWIFNANPKVAMFVFCRWNNLLTFPIPKSFIVWDKMVQCGMGDLANEYIRTWEGIAFYPGPEHKFVHRPPDIIHCKKIDNDKYTHPTEKPVGVVTPLIEAHEGNVFDPFMGSGTTLVAAKMCGRKSIGIEIEEKFCELAANRLQATERGQSLKDFIAGQEVLQFE